MSQNTAELSMTSAPNTQPRASSNRWIFIVAAVVLLGGAFYFLPVQSWLLSFLEWVQGLGLLGPVVLGASFIPAAVFLIPASLLSLGAGFLFGLPVGVVSVSIGSTIAAAAAFWVGRKLGNETIEAKIAESPKFAAIQRAVAKDGIKIVALTRLSPLFPYTFLNYAFGFTKVRFRDYILASWLGMLPGTILYVYLGTAVGDLASLGSGASQSVGARVALYVGLAATALVTVLVTRTARRALAEVTADGEDQ